MNFFACTTAFEVSFKFVTDDQLRESNYTEALQRRINTVKIIVVRQTSLSWDTKSTRDSEEQPYFSQIFEAS